MTKNKKTTKAKKEPKLLKLDIGCGKNKCAPDFIGIDIMGFAGVDMVMDVVQKLPKYKATDRLTNGYDKYKKWPWETGSVDEVHCSHFLEHLTSQEKVFFVNELCRVMKRGSKAQIIVPAWSSARYYGDLTHQSPPISEMWFLYLNAKWRSTEAPHNDFYTCNFDGPYGYNMHADLHHRNDEYRTFALTFYKEAASDIVATLIKL